MTIFSNLRAIDSLRNPVFRTYFFSRLSDAAAVNMRQMALIYLMYRLTGSATLLGVLIVARGIPLLIVTPLAGAIADRVQKKYVVQLAGVLDVFISLGIALGLTTGYLSEQNVTAVWILIVASLLDGIVTSFKGPANDALIVEVVGEGLITNAVALNQVGMNTLRLVAPALAGVMIDVFGFEIVYYVMVVLYLGAVFLLVFVPPTSKPVHSDTHILNDIKTVVHYIMKERNILFVLVTVFCVVFLSMPYRQLLPIFVDDILKVGATGMGLLNSLLAVGSIAGSIFLASLPNNKGRGVLMLVSAFILGLSLAFFAFSTSWVLSLLLMVAIGIGQAGRMTLTVAILQSYTKSEYRARVMSFYGVEFGLSNFGAFFAAILSNSIGVEWSVGGLALGLVVLSLLAFFFVPRLRKLD